MRLNADLMNVGNGFLAVPALIQNAVIVFGRLAAMFFGCATVCVVEVS
jgi:ABC-type siderophore export system fused ATPase/permease subunit